MIINIRFEKRLKEKKFDNVNEVFWFNELLMILLDKVSYNLIICLGCVLNIIRG